jgi:tRNA(Arg) A34 adenosine deaminase TadA
MQEQIQANLRTNTMDRSFPPLHVELPPWVSLFIASCDSEMFSTVEGRMRFAIGLACENSKAGTGGPFGAAIFNLTTHELIAPGINLVISSQCSVLHAEIVAIMIAQKRIGSFDLRGRGLQQVELVSSVAPCAMCLGAIPWAGISRLVCGGRDEDAQAVGFDEGAKVQDWTGELKKRGIETVLDICRHAAIEVLRNYKAAGGAIYNSNNRE